MFGSWQKSEPIKPEWMRRKAMDDYAKIQILKLKIIVVLIIINVLVRL